MQKDIRITVVTVAFNAREALETTIKSVAGQDYANLEYIVIDGGYGGTEASTVINCTTDDFEIIRQGKGELIY